MKQALVLAEFAPEAIIALEVLGYTVALAGWGQTHRALTEHELSALMAGTALLVVEVEEVTAAVIAAAPKLEIIASCRSQPVNVDVRAATARGIAVLSTPARNADSVAEFTLGLMLALGRNICRASQHLREHGWHVNDEIPYFHFRGPELAGKTLGLAGCGAIGRAVAQRTAALGMRVLGYDPYVRQQDLGDLLHLTTLETLLAESDFVSFHVTLNDATRGMIGAPALALMKRTSYLINTSRAAVIDEAALYDALRERRIAGAALDVFWREPLRADSPWLELDNVLLTPHLAGAADDVVRHHSAMVVEDVRSLLNLQPPARLANPGVHLRS